MNNNKNYFLIYKSVITKLLCNLNLEQTCDFDQLKDLEIITIYDLKKFALDNNLLLLPIELKDNITDYYEFPLLAFLNNDDKLPVVLVINKNNSFYIDYNGKKHYLNDVKEVLFESIAYKIFSRKIPKITGLLDFFNHISLKRKSFYFVYICCILSIVLILGVFPFIVEYITDDILLTGNVGLLISYSSFFCFLCILYLGLSFISQLGVVFYNYFLSEKLQSLLFAKVLSLPCSYIQSKNPIKLTDELLSSCNHVLSFLTVVNQLFLCSLIALVSAILLFCFNIKLAIIVISLVILLTIILSFINIKINRYTDVCNENANKLKLDIKNFLDFNERIHLDQDKGSFANKIDEDSKKYISLSSRRVKKKHFAKFINEASSLIIIIIVLYFCYGMVSIHDNNISILFAFMTCFYIFFYSISRISWCFFRIKNTSKNLYKLINFFNEESENSYNEHNNKIIYGDISFKDVSFQYQNSQHEILNQATFKIKKGKITAIVGESGSGKSTIINLLLGFLKPLSGTIYIDQQNINDINLSLFRSQIGAVLQSSTIFETSILDNILCGAVCSNDKVQRALVLSDLVDEIEKLPMKLKTIISRKTTSPGFQQKILLARALVCEPEILILDGSFFSLDMVSLNKINSHIKKLNITRIIVLNSSESIDLPYDEIFTINFGKIISLKH